MNNNNKVQGDIRLVKVVSLLDCVAFIVGSVIGSGIFISPKGVLQEVGSPAAALTVWAVTAVIALISALTQIELGLTYPRIGSTYLYIREAFGETTAFIYSWTVYIFMTGTALAIMGQTFSAYVSQMFFASCAPPDILIKLIAGIAILTLFAIQTRGTSMGIWTTKFLTLSKLTGLMVVIVAGVYFMATERRETAVNLANFSYNTSTDFGSYVLAFFSASWAYSGLSACVGIIEDLKEPLKRNILTSLVISVFLVAVVYILANLAYLAVLNPSEMLASDAVAMTLLNKVFPGLFWVMPFFVACSTLGAMNNALMFQARFAMAVARRRHLPNTFALLTLDKKAPIPAVTFTTIMSLALLFSGGVYDLIIYVSFISSIFSILVNVGHIKLRIQQPNLVRPFRVPMAVICLDMTIAVVAAVFPLIKRPFSSLMSLAFAASAIPIYFIFIRPEKAPKMCLTLERNVLHFLQKIFNALPETVEDATGKRQMINNDSHSHVNKAFEK